MNDKGSIIWRVLFGVVMAALLIGILIAYTSTQRRYAAGGEAQQLATSLSKTAFSALPRQKQTFDLYKSVGRSDYKVIVENDTFSIKVLGGGQEGKEYRSSVGVDITVQPPPPEPGETLYMQGAGDIVIVSSSPVEPPEENLTSPSTYEPPDFYGFAKENPKEATGIISAYYYAKQNYSGEKSIDIQDYKWKSSSLNVRVTAGGDFLTTVEISGGKNSENVGLINETWIVTKIENTKNDISNTLSCPSVKEAHMTQWLYPPDEVSSKILKRTWKKTADNEIVTLPDNLNPIAASATTNVSTYPTWRFEFESDGTPYILHFAAFPWEFSENQPGFILESKPDLEAKT